MIKFQFNLDATIDHYNLIPHYNDEKEENIFQLQS